MLVVRRALALALVLLGCSSSESERVVEPPPAEAWPNLACDPLVPSRCGFPFPSNVYSVEDDGSPTGRRVSILQEMLPVPVSGYRSSPEALNAADGFSSAAALLTLMPGVRLDGVATPDDLDRSLSADSPTVLLHAETGERVAHFVELDINGRSPEERTLLIRPVERLADGARYLVAIRNLPDASGVPLPPSPAFAALRDLTVSAEPSVEARRPLYADIFARLAEAGVARETLQLAWDFTTASRQSNTAWMVHMRDEALELAGEAGPSFTIDSVDEAYDERLAARIDGSFEVPLYLDDTLPGGRLNLGADGLPEPVGTYPVKFVALVPKRASAEDPAALLQYGHGLLGSHSQVAAGNFRELAERHNYVIFGVTMWGMGQDIDDAWSDSTWIGEVLASGRMDELPAMFERQHQGIVNQLLAMRMMSRGMADDETWGPRIDAAARYYHGISQGGIFGGTYMALTTDVQRGVLGVMGMPYNLLLDRSVDFSPFFLLLGFSFPDARDQQLLLAMTQMLWDRAEPNGYVPYLREGSPLGAPPHEVLMRAAIGDHQVPTLGAHLMARAAGAVHLDSGLRDVWGLTKVTEAETGSAYVEYDFGLPPEPVCNAPMTACDDPHGKLRHLDESVEQLDTFLRTGVARSFCEGACSFPEQSGCAAGEEAIACSVE